VGLEDYFLPAELDDLLASLGTENTQIAPATNGETGM
jgi:hypothetical protein